jgi:DNA-binding NtrC family response regulator
MKANILVLIVHDDPNILLQLKTLLSAQNISTRYATTCYEARLYLSGERLPEVIFCGPNFADGTWRDVIALTRALEPRPAAVMATGQVDIPLYLDAMEEDAADYIVPPFAPNDLGALLARVVPRAAGA